MSRFRMNRRRFVICDRLPWGNSHTARVASLGYVDGERHIGIALSTTGHWQCYVGHLHGHDSGDIPRDECHFICELYVLYRMIGRLHSDGVRRFSLLSSDVMRPRLMEWQHLTDNLPLWRSLCTASVGSNSLSGRIVALNHTYTVEPHEATDPCLQAAAHMLSTVIECDEPLPEDRATDDRSPSRAIGRRIKRHLMGLLARYDHLPLHARA